MKLRFSKYPVSILPLLMLCSLVFGDGLLLPAEEENYPKDFLLNKSSEVRVTIHGCFAETVVYQEYLNESGNYIDAVYAFPLPADARATRLYYWRNDTAYIAVLKVKQQSTTPGTGEGGIAALVNKYIGSNGLKLKLEDIPPHTIQKIELHYISPVKSTGNVFSYDYPMETADFIKYPLDYVRFSVELKSQHKIIGASLVPTSGYNSTEIDSSHIIFEFLKSKYYPTHDIIFQYSISRPGICIDWFSTKKSDSTIGYFGMTVYGNNEIPSPLNNRIIFLLSNSNTMTGYKLDQSIQAVKEAISLLAPGDYFNIIVYNYYTLKWEELPVEANATNVTNAITFLESVSVGYGSLLNYALEEALGQIQDNQYNNVILAFTDGQSLIYPDVIAQKNTNKTGVYFIALGDNIDRARLELTSMYNYGMVTYLDETSNIKQGVRDVFDRISQPVLKNPEIQFMNTEVHSIMPPTMPTLNTGSEYSLTGRYYKPATDTAIISGTGYAGPEEYEFPVIFQGQDTLFSFIKYFWAKEIIDILEREILVFGKEESLKDSLISMSLRYNIRCRYTSYIADYMTVTEPEDPDETHMSINEEVTQPPVSASFLSSCYPNPFTFSTNIRIYIHRMDIHKKILLRIFDLNGRMIGFIDLSNFTEGWHTVSLNLEEVSGTSINPGIYYARLSVDDLPSGILMMNYLK